MLLRQRVGSWLATRPLRKGDLGRIARKLRVKVRTLLNWRKAAGRPLKRQGRPPATAQERHEALASVRWLILREGWMGWRMMALSLPWVSTRMVQWAVASLKARRRRLQRRKLGRNRVHYHYTTQGVVTAQDTAHVGECKGGRIYTEVMKDPATFQGEADGNGSKPTAKSVLAQLEQAEEEGRLCLVHQTDNDKAYCSKKVREWRREHKVIHLLSRPHTPQDNPFVERFIGELKHSYFTLGREHYCQSPQEGVSDAEQIAQRLNDRPRLAADGKTANQLAQELPHWNSKVLRDIFYEQACKAIEEATRGLKGLKARTAEREAIFQTMEKFGFLIRSRGEGSAS